MLLLDLVRENAPDVKTLLAVCFAFVDLGVADASSHNLPGGYFGVEPAAAEVRSSADFAVREKSSAENPMMLKNILKAEKQIVAGVNYRLVLLLKQGGVDRRAGVVVFRDLKSRYRLKSWQWLDGPGGQERD